MSLRLDRREMLRGLALSAPLAAVLRDPGLARAAAAGLQDVRLTTAGGRSVAASLAVPAAGPAPAVLLIHEWWGLNDQIKVMAAEFAREGFAALAVDLFDGRTASTREEAERLRQSVEPAAATDTLVSWIAWLKANLQPAGTVATCGWCFGGGWSLEASVATISAQSYH